MSEKTIEDRVLALEQQVEFLMKQRSGKRPKPMTRLHEVGVCAVNPECDSAECPDASIYRYQQGCRGTGCVVVNSEYYKNHRLKKETERVDI